MDAYEIRRFVSAVIGLLFYASAWALLAYSLIIVLVNRWGDSSAVLVMLLVAGTLMWLAKGVLSWSTGSTVAGSVILAVLGVLLLTVLSAESPGLRMLEREAAAVSLGAAAGLIWLISSGRARRAP